MEMLKDNLMNLVQIVLTGIIPIMGGYLIYLVQLGVSTLKAKTQGIKNTQQKVLVDNAIDRVDTLIQTNVIAMQETLVKDIKEYMNDGVVTKEELAKVKDNVIELVKGQMSDELTNLMMTEIKDVDSYLSNRIEEILKEVKDNMVL